MKPARPVARSPSPHTRGAYRNLKPAYDQPELPHIRRDKPAPILGLSAQTAATIHLRAAALAAASDHHHQHTRPGPVFDPTGLVAPIHQKPTARVPPPLPKILHPASRPLPITNRIARLAGSGGTDSIQNSPNIRLRSQAFPRKKSAIVDCSADLLETSPKPITTGKKLQQKGIRHTSHIRQWLPTSMRKLENLFLGSNNAPEYRSSSVPRSMKYPAPPQFLIRGAPQTTSSKLSDTSRDTVTSRAKPTTSRLVKPPQATRTSTRVIDSSMLSQYFAQHQRVAAAASNLQPITERQATAQSGVSGSRVSGVPVNLQTPLPPFLQNQQRNRNIWSAGGGEFFSSSAMRFAPKSRENTSQQRVFTANTTKTRTLRQQQQQHSEFLPPPSHHNASVMGPRAESPLIPIQQMQQYYTNRRQSNPITRPLEGLPVTKGIYSKIKSELLRGATPEPPQSQYGLHVQPEAMEIIHGQSPKPASSSDSRYSSQVPKEPQKPTISELSFPEPLAPSQPSVSPQSPERKRMAQTAVVEHLDDEEVDEEEEGQIDEFLKLQREFSETYASAHCKDGLNRAAADRPKPKIARLKLAQLPRTLASPWHRAPKTGPIGPMTDRALQKFGSQRQGGLLLDDTLELEHAATSAREGKQYREQLSAITHRLDNIVTNLEKFNSKIQQMSRGPPTNIFTPQSLPHPIGEVPFSDKSSTDAHFLFTSGSLGGHARSPQPMQPAESSLEEIKFDELSSYASGPSTPHLSQIDSAYGRGTRRNTTPRGQKGAVAVGLGLGGVPVVGVGMGGGVVQHKKSHGEMSNQQQPQGAQKAKK